MKTHWLVTILATTFNMFIVFLCVLPQVHLLTSKIYPAPLKEELQVFFRNTPHNSERAKI